MKVPVGSKSNIYRYIAMAGIVLVVAVGSYIAGKHNSDNTTTPKTDSMVTITGTGACIPHKPAGGTSTLECLWGLKSKDGTYYHVKHARTGDASLLLPDDETQALVTGTLVAPAPDDKYDTAGTITIESVTKL